MLKANCLGMDLQPFTLHVDHRVCVSVIRGLEHDEIDRPGMGSRETQRQLFDYGAENLR
jgi:hypothetical protein